MSAVRAGAIHKLIIYFSIGVELLVTIVVATACPWPPIVDVVDCAIETLAADPVVSTVLLPRDDYWCGLAAQEILQKLVRPGLA